MFSLQRIDTKISFVTPKSLHRSYHAQVVNIGKQVMERWVKPIKLIFSEL